MTPYFYMRVVSIILSLVTVLCLCGFTSDKEAAKVFGNMTYFLGNDGETVTLKNGRFFKRFCWDVYYDRRFVYGDFNHDGLKDAAVIIVINYGGGNTNDYTLAFLINNGHQLVHRASYYLDNWAIINSLQVKRDKAIVDMYVHQQGDCNAGPSKRVRRIYAYSGQNIFFSLRKNWNLIK